MSTSERKDSFTVCVRGPWSFSAIETRAPVRALAQIVRAFCIQDRESLAVAKNKQV